MKTKHSDSALAGYSHGLEKVYAFETVDPRTVRTLSVETAAEPQAAPKQAETTAVHTPAKEEQLLFSFVAHLPSLRLQEPIEVLGLTPFAQKGLLSLNKKTVQEALELIRSNQRTHKGLGQGHIEEIQTKIAAYLHDHTDNKPSIDFKALCRILCHDLDSKERYIVLSSCSLQSLTTISAAETAEIERWTRKERLRCLSAAITSCQTKHADFLKAILKQISEAYLISWVQQRHGFTTRAELLQCMQGLSGDPQAVKGAILLLELLCSPQTLFDRVLDPIEPNVYAANSKIKEDFLYICRQGASYFYHPFVTYPLEMLVQFIRKDLTRKWIGLEEGFIEKVLTTSSRFTYSNRQICLGISPN
ncbi:MAG: hypothetical protein JSR46_00705 [Verrucomicrobia bacterium]|nr:hypothetical protein [Verrucomicrobiota bacterium]